MGRWGRLDNAVMKILVPQNVGKIMARQWRAERGLGGSNPPPEIPKF